MGGFGGGKGGERFAVQAPYIPMAMLSSGYADEMSTLEGENLTRETAARKRRPLNELLFGDSWGKAID